eukprot:2744669-Amphidinium_carterae.1
MRRRKCGCLGFLELWRHWRFLKRASFFHAFYFHPGVHEGVQPIAAPSLDLEAEVDPDVPEAVGLEVDQDLLVVA